MIKNTVDIGWYKLPVTGKISFFKMLLSFLAIAASIVCISALHDGRIVNGRETFIENFPHQVS